MATQAPSQSQDLSPFEVEQAAQEALYNRALAAADRARKRQHERPALTVPQADAVYRALKRFDAHSPLADRATTALFDAATSDEEDWQKLSDWQQEIMPFDQTYFIEASADVEAQARAIVALFDAVRRSTREGK